MKEQNVPPSQWPVELQIEAEQKAETNAEDFLLVDPDATKENYFAEMLKKALEDKKRI